MADIINLRTARKRAERQSDAQNADAQRLAHGQPKHVRDLHKAQRDKAVRSLEQHKVETGDNS